MERTRTRRRFHNATDGRAAKLRAETETFSDTNVEKAGRLEPTVVFLCSELNTGDADCGSGGGGGSQECGSDNGINAEFLSPGSSRTEGIKASDVLPVLKEKVAFVSGEFPPLLSCRDAFHLKHVDSHHARGTFQTNKQHPNCNIRRVK